MARFPKNPDPDEGKFTLEDLATQKAIIIRWDAWEHRPTVHLGEVSAHEAYGWVQATSEELWELIESRGAHIKFD